MRTELPERWYILATEENMEFAGSWRSGGPFRVETHQGFKLMHPGWPYDDSIGYAIKPSDDKEREYLETCEELTLEEFKVLVLKILPPVPEPILAEDVSYLENFFKERNLI